MKKILLLLAISLALLGNKARAQIILDDFTTGVQVGEGSAKIGSSWVGVGQVVQGVSTITIGGTAHDDNGWTAINLPTFDASGMLSITITGQLDAGNSAPSFNVEFIDVNTVKEAFSISSSVFLTGIMTTVSIPLGPWLFADPTQLNGWSIGGGGTTTTGPDFRMTLDQLALSPSAIPEPGAVAALAGIFVLGFAVWRRLRPDARAGDQSAR